MCNSRVSPVSVLAGTAVVAAVDLLLEAVIAFELVHFPGVTGSNVLEVEVDHLVAAQVVANTCLWFTVVKHCVGEIQLASKLELLESSWLLRGPRLTVRETSGIRQGGGSEGNEEWGAHNE